MANDVEPMDIDMESEFDNKENTCHGNLLQRSTHKFSGSASTAPMSKSFTGHSCFTPDQNEQLTRSLGPLATSNDVLKSLKLPLTEISRESSACKEEPGSVQTDLPNVDVTVTINDDIDENISFPSSSSSSPSTPVATTPTKEILKPTGSPIMRGLKSMLSMFRPSQSPIIPIENETEQDKISTNENINNLSTINNPEVIHNNLKTMSSTPISKEISTSKRNSPLRESIIFKEELSNELTWKNDSTIIFSEEKIPIHKLFYNLPPACSSSTKQNKENQLNESVEPMDISCIESIVTEEVAKSNEPECNKYLSETKLLDDTGKDDSIFVDCESTFNIDSCDESQLLKTFDEAEYHPTIDPVTKDDGETNAAKEHIEETQITQISIDNNDSTLKETIGTSNIINVAVSKMETVPNISSADSSKLILDTTKDFGSKTLDVLNRESHQNSLNGTKIPDTTTLETINPIENEDKNFEIPAILNDKNANNSYDIETGSISLSTTKIFQSNEPEPLNDDCSPCVSDSDNIKVISELHKEEKPNTEQLITNQINTTSFISAEEQNLQEVENHENIWTEIREEATKQHTLCFDNLIQNNISTSHEAPSLISNVDNAQLTEMDLFINCKINQDSEVDLMKIKGSLTVDNEINVASEGQVLKNNDNDDKNKTVDELNTLDDDVTVEFKEYIHDNDVDGIKNTTFTESHVKNVSLLKMNDSIPLQNCTTKLKSVTELSDHLDPVTIIHENDADIDTVVSSSTNLLKNKEESCKNFTNMPDSEKHNSKSNNIENVVNSDQNINSTIEIPTSSSLTFDARPIDNTNMSETTGKDILKFENSSSIGNAIKSSDIDFDNIMDPFATKQKIRMSPPATPSRKVMEKNISIDNVENPFASKTKIRLSPPPTNRFVLDDNQENKCAINEKPKDIFSGQTSMEVSSTEEMKVNSDLEYNEEYKESSNEIGTKPFNDLNLENETIASDVNQPDIVKDSLQNQYDVTKTIFSDNDIIQKSDRTFNLDNCSNQSIPSEIHASTSSEIATKIMLPTDNNTVLKATEVDENMVSESFSPDGEISKHIHENTYVADQSDVTDIGDQLVTKDLTSYGSISSSVVDKLHSKLNLTPEVAIKTEIESDETKYIGINSDSIITTNETHVPEQTESVNIEIQCDDKTNTDDEDTLEGPFLDIENTCTDDKMELNPFTDHNLPIDETEPGEMFIDAQAFEFLMNQNVNNFVDNGKESLFLKFDPLCAPRLNADGVTGPLSKITKRENYLAECSAPSNKLNATEETISDDSVDDLNNTVSHKPTMAVTPAVSNVTAAPIHNTDTRVRFNLHPTQSPAVAVIDQLLSLSANNSPAGREPTTNCVPVQNEAQITLMHLQQVLTEKTQNILQLRRESVQLKERLTTLESQMKILESQNEEKLGKINDLNEALADKTKVNKSMASVVEEYERTIAVLISETEQEKKKHAEERAKLMSERDEQTAHLASMEVSFSDLHSKYEKSKQIIQSYKANEDIYRKSLIEFEESVKKMQANYDSLKQHATAKLNQANTELEKINRTHETEVLKLNTVIKRKELHINSLEESLIQKTKANEELTAICDELITKVG